MKIFIDVETGGLRFREEIPYVFKEKAYTAILT